MEQQLIDKMNLQIANEMGSAVLYKNMQYYFEGIGMINTAEYYNKQAEGEQSHADGIAKFLADRKINVYYEVTTFPIQEKNVYSILNQTLMHEKYVTEMLYEIYEMACDYEEPLVKVFMHDYLKEQIEEEAVSQSLIDTFSLTSDMLIFDNRVKDLI